MRKLHSSGALCALLLAACTIHGRVGTLPTLANPEQAAEIVVIREWRFIGGGANFTVLLDDVPLYGIAVDEHVVLRVSPGDHILTISRRGPFLNDAAATVRAEPRRRYYYRLETSAWSSDITLLPVAPAAGEELMTKTRRVQRGLRRQGRGEPLRGRADEAVAQCQAEGLGGRRGSLAAADQHAVRVGARIEAA